jgi:hypothetical protein
MSGDMASIGTKVAYSMNEIKHLPADEQKEFCRSIIAEVLKNNPNGLSANQIAEITNFDSKTVRKHLEYLVAIRDAYRAEYGDRFTLYFPNGTLAHAISNNTYRVGDKYYSFKLIKNSFGEFIFVQEKTKDEFNRYTTLGGLVVEKEYFGHLIKKLISVAMELKIPIETDGSPFVVVSV